MIKIKIKKGEKIKAAKKEASSHLILYLYTDKFSHTHKVIFLNIMQSDRKSSSRSVNLL